MPKRFDDERELRSYAMSFFGFGSWRADCWLIGIEERGAKRRQEFCKRYKAWAKFGRRELADLVSFTNAADVEVDWQNQTWKRLHRLCKEAGMLDEPLCSCVWGNAKQVARRRRVALIEAMPFPAKNTDGWPYAHWRTFMKTRGECEREFLKMRAAALHRRCAK